MSPLIIIDFLVLSFIVLGYIQCILLQYKDIIIIIYYLFVGSTHFIQKRQYFTKFKPNRNLLNNNNIDVVFLFKEILNLSLSYFNITLYLLANFYEIFYILTK